VQILVVVANTQVRALRTEVEKGFERTAFDLESVDPKGKVNSKNRCIPLKNKIYFIFIKIKSLHPCLERESG